LALVADPGNGCDRNAVLIYKADDLTEDLGYLDATGAVPKVIASRSGAMPFHLVNEVGKGFARLLT